MKSFVGSLAQICLMGQIMKSNLNLNLNLIFHEQDAIKKDKVKKLYFLTS